MKGVGVIVPCRVGSSRLPNKALADLDGVPAIERCLSNALRIPTADVVVLATTETEEDLILADHTLNGRADFWRGSLDDVIGRFLGACEKHDLHTVVRITGDCPSASWEMAERLLQEHLESGADCTLPERFAIGMNSDVFSVKALKHIHDHFGRADYSEYMSWYFMTNDDIFTVRKVPTPDDWVRDYRLTLDYREDVDMFDVLFRRLRENGWDADIQHVFSVLDADPSIPAMNANLAVKYRDDPDLIQRLKEATRMKGVS